MFRTPASLKRHVRHDHFERFTCELCKLSETTFSNRALIKHKYEVHGVEKNLFQCNICNHATKNRTHYGNHLLTHSERKDHICSECGKTFKQETSLDRHMKRHNDMFDFACNLCGKIYDDRYKCE